MNESEAKEHLIEILQTYDPGTLLHILAQVIRESEEARFGCLDDTREERVREAGPNLACQTT